MNRVTEEPRKDWQKTVEASGLIYHTPDGKPYWDESASYHFSAQEIDMLEAVTESLHSMCLEAVQYVIDKDLFGRLRIPAAAVPMIKEAWNNEVPALHGRFDLAYDGVTPPKMLEFNADTPTALLEASVIQWDWMKTVHPKADQFNSIHDKLLAKWKELREYLNGERLYFSSIDDAEDAMTVTYLRDVASQVGIRCEPLQIEDIGWNGSVFVDLKERQIQSIYKLYPWEWMLEDTFGAKIDSNIQWIEPIWKMVLSNKGILTVLWEMYPDHPNLLATYFTDKGHLLNKQYVRKPLYSREGRNILLRDNGLKVFTDGNYGTEGYVFQALAKIPKFDGQYPIIGSWYVLDQGPAGIGIRESSTPITDNRSRFVPHWFD